MSRTAPAIALVLAAAVPASAQTSGGSGAPTVSLRGFGMVAGEDFTASKTFDATLGGSFQPFFGGGVEVTVHDALFIDATFSRFRKTGERAFVFGGRTFKLGIPLRVTVTPFEVTGGYRFHFGGARRIVPYAGAGIGTYKFRETSSFSDNGENVDVRHAGYLLVGGAELRLYRWVGLAGDAQYTHVPGILGKGGLSQQVDEDDLGGIAVRLKVIIGR